MPDRQVVLDKYIGISIAVLVVVVVNLFVCFKSKLPRASRTRPTAEILWKNLYCVTSNDLTTTVMAM